MTEKDLQARLFRKFKHKYIFLNTHFFHSEQDWISFLNSGYCWEIEIKLSYADFKRDFRKKKHSLMKTVFKTKGRSDVDKHVPNRFYFFAPAGIIDKKDLPEYAGLLTLEGNRIKVTKKAPLLHKSKLRPERVFKKLYYMYERSLLKKLFPDSPRFEEF